MQIHKVYHPINFSKSKKFHSRFYSAQRLINVDFNKNTFLSWTEILKYLWCLNAPFMVRKFPLVIKLKRKKLIYLKIIKITVNFFKR